MSDALIEWIIILAATVVIAVGAGVAMYLVARWVVG